jgi:hypothetical protein
MGIRLAFMILYSLSAISLMHFVTRGEYPRIIVRSRKNDIVALVTTLLCAAAISFI